MKLLAISDLHLGYEVNRQALAALPPHPEDWLILGGDVCENLALFTAVLEQLRPLFAELLWVPGNHELWSREGEAGGEAKYQALVAACRQHGVHSPEDPFVRWSGDGPQTWLAPLFVLYDYSFAPDGFSPDEAKAWALEHGIVCADERYLRPDPHPSREAWCAARLSYSQRRLAEIPALASTVLINHFPLRQDLAILPRVPRFSPWCGTRKTEDWHLRYRARAVVQGHLHIRGTNQRDGVPFHEVSFGYPRDWDREAGILPYLRRIL